MYASKRETIFFFDIAIRYHWYYFHGYIYIFFKNNNFECFNVQVKIVAVEKKVNEIVNRLEKTKAERYPDLAAEKESRDREERNEKKAQLQEHKKKEKEEQKRKKEMEELK